MKFSDQRMDGCEFKNCSLANAIVHDVNLSGARLTNANLSGLIIENANIKGFNIFGYYVASMIREQLRKNGCHLTEGRQQRLLSSATETVGPAPRPASAELAKLCTSLCPVAGMRTSRAEGALRARDSPCARGINASGSPWTSNSGLRTFATASSLRSG